MVSDEGDDLGLARQIPVPCVAPKYLRAHACSSAGFVFDEFDCAPTFSYGKSTVPQRRKLFSESLEGSGDQVSTTSFEVEGLYEAWMGRDDLIGMCEVELSAEGDQASIDFYLYLHTVYVAPRYRGQGVGRELCRLAAEHEFERIANIILAMPNMHAAPFRLTVDADVRNDAGIAAAQALLMHLGEFAELLSLSQDIEIEVEQAFDDWCH